MTNIISASEALKLATTVQSVRRQSKISKLIVMYKIKRAARRGHYGIVLKHKVAEHLNWLSEAGYFVEWCPLLDVTAVWWDKD